MKIEEFKVTAWSKKWKENYRTCNNKVLKSTAAKSFAMGEILFEEHSHFQKYYEYFITFFIEESNTQVFMYLHIITKPQ